MASSGNPRQFIQRRGRVLRPHPNKQRATIFDMIVLPPDLGRETLEVERNFLRKELTRFVEFADLADNAGEARGPVARFAKALRIARPIDPGTMTQEPTSRNVMEPINAAPPEIKSLIQKVLKAENDKLHTKQPRGINDDILRIIKEEVQ